MTAGQRYAYGFVRLMSAVLSTLTSLRDDAERERNDDVLVAIWKMRERADGGCPSRVDLADVHREITGQRIDPDRIHVYVGAARERRAQRKRGESAFSVFRRAIHIAKGHLDGSHPVDDIEVR